MTNNEEEIRDLKAALVEARGGTYAQPKEGWQCFHCGEWFTTLGSAESHFGRSPDSKNEEILRLLTEITDLKSALSTSRLCTQEIDAEVERIKQVKHQFEQAWYQASGETEAANIEIAKLRSQLAVAQGMRAKAEFLQHHGSCRLPPLVGERDNSGYVLYCDDERHSWKDEDWIAQVQAVTTIYYKCRIA